MFRVNLGNGQVQGNLNSLKRAKQALKTMGGDGFAFASPLHTCANRYYWE
jgi:hypothetical protein